MHIVYVSHYAFVCDGFANSFKAVCSQMALYGLASYFSWLAYPFPAFD